jgi:hypothetical protein
MERVEDDESHRLDVLNTNVLGMEVGDDVGLICVIEIREDGGGRGNRELLLNDLVMLQGIHIGLQLLPHEGNDILMLMSDDGLDNSKGHDKGEVDRDHVVPCR